jgi:predicted transcriptional regulator
MVKVYRTEPQIMIAILHTCQPCAGITRIVYDNNLNFELASKYLNKMIGKGYIVKETTDNRVWYRTTDVGVDMILKLVDVVHLIEEIRA